MREDETKKVEVTVTRAEQREARELAIHMLLSIMAMKPKPAPRVVVAALMELLSHMPDLPEDEGREVAPDRAPQARTLAPASFKI